MLIIRRLNRIDAASGIVTLSQWPYGAQVERVQVCWQLASKSICSCSQAVNKPVWHIPLLCVQWKIPDDGQRNCPKDVEFHSKIKFWEINASSWFYYKKHKHILRGNCRDFFKNVYESGRYRNWNPLDFERCYYRLQNRLDSNKNRP